ncbi:MAG: hypothetical protein SVM86_08240 [Candidatus Cloacimonadota bacterium]|nr:hypothetical protein [Candidatus Cloacimonadota bacterium]
MKLIKNIQMPISKQLDVQAVVSKKLQISSSHIENLQILRRSLDARKKNSLKYNFTAIAELPQVNHPDVLEYTPPQPHLQECFHCPSKNPYIVGAGPAGLFAALALCEKGYEPYIFERGDKIEVREEKVRKFWQNGILDPESNVQFGEGGAGTFSDGKLTARNRDYYTNQIFSLLVKFGAPYDIKIDAKPHLGTDRLKFIITNIRKYLQEKGCHFYWKHKLENITIKNNKLTALTINNEQHKPACAILALGNAARDTFSELKNYLHIVAKPFSVGVRIEHQQSFINASFYGNKTDFSLTGPAIYRLTSKYKDRGIYSFCMCPGGIIIAATNQINTIVTNGMSYSNRPGKLANSAIVVTVSPADFGSSAVAGIEFQEKIEKTAFNAELPYFAPVQKASAYLTEVIPNKIETSYLPGTYSRNLNNIFPSFINSALKSALKKFDNRYPGFLKYGTLIAPETRTSSPVRFLREKNSFLCQDKTNVFVIGEGSGYAGGIISSAADGYKLGNTFRTK